MTTITKTQPTSALGSEIENLSICQTLLLLIQKIKNAIVQAFSLCCVSIKNICCCLRQKSISLTQPKALSEAEKDARVKETIAEVNRTGKQEHLFLAEIFDLHPFASICKHPQCLRNDPRFVYPVYRGTPVVYPDFAQVQNRMRQALFETLSLGLQNSLSALGYCDRISILNRAHYEVTKEYKDKVYLLENDLYQHFSQVGVSKRLKFKSDELDEPAKTFLQKNLSQPLEQRLQSFSPFIQKALFNSAYCQMKKAATGK